MTLLNTILEKMTSFHCVSGIEQDFARWFKNEVTPYADKIEIDRAGNLIARRGKEPAIGLFAHMDTVGFMVKRISPEEGVEVVKIGAPRGAQPSEGIRLFLWGRGETHSHLDPSPPSGDEARDASGVPEPRRPPVPHPPPGHQAMDCARGNSHRNGSPVTPAIRPATA